MAERWTNAALQEALNAVRDHQAKLLGMPRWPRNDHERERDKAISLALSILRGELARLYRRGGG